MNLPKKQKKVKDKERREAVGALWEMDKKKKILLTLQDSRHDRNMTLLKEMHQKK